MAIEIGTMLKQRFLLEKELGRGGMGAVYSAVDQVLDRSVAIKVLKDRGGEEVGKRLRLEARIAARLLHESVVRIYDFDESDGFCFLVMEQVDGSTYARRWRNLAMEARLKILSEVAEALDYAHHQGVVHRDIKPGNVLLTAADAPKLSDFGLSILVEQGDDSGAIRGTPLYMSPEQTRGVPLDFRSDLYSLGVMVYESTVGSTPFAGNSVTIMAQHATTLPAPPRSKGAPITEDLEALICSMLAKRPDDRPRSGSSIAEVLRREAERVGADRPTAGSAPAAGTLTAAVTVDMPRTASAGPPSDNGRPAETTAAPASTGRVTPSLASGRPPSSASVATTGGLTALVRSPLLRRMLETVLDGPILLSPEERYLTGHYLAYLLSGSRRRGILMRRPMDPRNADRARLLLAMTHTMVAGADDQAIAEAAELLDQRIEVRVALSPVVAAKYLAARSSPALRKLFRRTRKAIAEASEYAREHMLDDRGVLNPGLMPQRLEDLNLIAPPRTEVDDVLVERWNLLAEKWRMDPRFRATVLRYATAGAHRDPASTAMWPEVVYPLIERARWQRRTRSKAEMAWDYLFARVIHMPDAGVLLDRALKYDVPAPLVAHLDDSLDLMVESPRLDDEQGDPFASPDADDRLAASISIEGGAVALAEIADEPEEAGRDVARLADPDPLRFSQAELHDLWKEALAALQQTQARPGVRPPSHRHVPVGPYRLTVIPSIRGRSAGQIAIQGMPQKQIELVTPTVRTKGSSSKALVAVWVYRDNSLVIAHLDFQGSERYVLWHAPRGHQINFDGPGDLSHELFSLGLEVPDQLNRVLTRSFRPSKKV